MNLLGLLGASLKHSFSPVMMNRLALQGDLPFAYFPFEIPAEKLPHFVEAVRLLPISGFNVTIPHKVAILSFLDELTPEVQAVGAVNTVLNRDGKLIGYNTDTAGFLGSVNRLFGKENPPRAALILGSGGAARAVLYTLLKSGTKTVFLFNRREERARKLAEDFGQLFPEKEIVPGPLKAAFLKQALARATLIVQTTSVGMWPHEEEELPFPFEALHPGHKVIDLIYNPEETRFLRDVRKRGAEALNGLPMLIGQAAKSLEIWGFPGLEANLLKIVSDLREKTTPQTLEEKC